MRCPECNKFAGLESQDPEVSDLAIDADGIITATVRLVRVSACCTADMKEATFELEHVLAVAGHDSEAKGAHELSVEEDGAEATERGGGRYAKSYHGVSLTVTVTCSCGELEASAELADEVEASAMDELA